MTRAGRWAGLGCLTMELVALSVWVGGLTVLVAAVIPAVFNIFGGQDAGGLFLTRAFEGYNRLVLGAMAVLGVGAFWRQWMADRGWPELASTRVEWSLLVTMIGIATVIIFVLHPQAAARQSDAFAMKDPDARKAALEAFFRIHQPVRWLYVGNLLLGVALLGAKVKSWVNRDEVRG